MKSWTQIRKDPRLVKDRIIYDRENPYDFQFAGEIRIKGAPYMSVIAGNDENGWERVSVCTAGRCPTWEEMCIVKDIFWRDDEACIQLHPMKSEYVNFHETCLHIWRMKDAVDGWPFISGKE